LHKDYLSQLRVPESIESIIVGFNIDKNKTEIGVIIKHKKKSTSTSYNIILGYLCLLLKSSITNNDITIDQLKLELDLRWSKIDSWHSENFVDGICSYTYD